MESGEEVASRWRAKAIELRAIAGRMDLPEAAQDLLDLALRWDLMAKRAEERAKIFILQSDG